MGRLDAETLIRLMKETGLGVDTLQKARVFAYRYSAGQLAELCKPRTPKGMPLPWRHVRQLLMLPPGEVRDALQRKAAERGWSLEELTEAIPKKVRRGQAGRAGGRAFRRPKTQADGLRKLVRHADEWLRRHRHRAWREFDWLGSRPGPAGPGGLRARAAEARASLRQMREVIRELDARLKMLEEQLVND